MRSRPKWISRPWNKWLPYSYSEYQHHFCGIAKVTAYELGFGTISEHFHTQIKNINENPLDDELDKDFVSNTGHSVHKAHHITLFFLDDTGMLDAEIFASGIRVNR